MPRQTYLLKRKGIYYIRVGIPNSIQNILKKSEIRYSLKTKNYREAIRKLRVEILKVDMMLENGKNKVHILTKEEAINILRKRLAPVYG